VSVPLLGSSCTAPQPTAMANLSDWASLGAEATEGLNLHDRTISQDMAVRTGRPQSAARAALDAVGEDRERAYTLLMSNLAVTVASDFPCEIVPLAVGEHAWLRSATDSGGNMNGVVRCVGDFADGFLLRAARNCEDALRLFALEPVQVFLIREESGETDLPAGPWSMLDGAVLPEIEKLGNAQSVLTTTFDPGMVVVPLKRTLLALLRLLKKPGARTPPCNSAEPAASTTGSRPTAAAGALPTLPDKIEQADITIRDAHERTPIGTCQPVGVGGYRIAGAVGSGAFGQVHLAERVSDGRKVAVKVLRPADGRMLREVELLSMLRHPFIVTFVESFEAPEESGRQALHIVMEYLPGNLHERIAGKPLEFQVLQSFSFQMLRALAYLNGLQVSHRDIKPQNILVDKQRLKLADFGSAKTLDGTSSSSYICSRWWRAPELVLGASEYSTSVDWWSCGCVIAEMMRGAPLFAGESSWGQMYEIVRVLGTPLPQQVKALEQCKIQGRIAKHLADLAEFNRPGSSWDQLLPVYARHSPAHELLRLLLAYSPQERIAPADALLCRFFVGLTDSADGQLLPEMFEFTEAEFQTCSGDTRKRLLGLAAVCASRVCQGSITSEKNQTVEVLAAEPSVAVMPSRAVAMAASRQRSGELPLEQLLCRVSLASARSRRSRSRRRIPRLARTRSICKGRPSTPCRGSISACYRSMEVCSPELKLRIGFANPMDMDESR